MMKKKEKGVLRIWIRDVLDESMWLANRCPDDLAERGTRGISPVSSVRNRTNRLFGRG